MNGFYANKLKGACQGTQYGNFEIAGNAFSAMGMHILTSTTQKTQPVIQQAGSCADSLILPWKTAGKTAYVYGSDPQTAVDPDAPPNHTVVESHLKFDYDEVIEWLPKKVQPSGIPSHLPYTITYEGPRFATPSTFIPMKRVGKDDTTVEQFKAVNWLDGNDADLGQDWLGLLYPGNHLHSVKGMPNPFLAEQYYEYSNKEIDRSGIHYHTHVIPFCKPLSVYDELEELRGYCDCLAFIPFFSGGILKDPLDGRPIGIIPGTDKVVRLPGTLQYISMEVWIYLGMNYTNPIDGFPMYSPRIARRRYWMFTQRRNNTLSEGNSPFDPYMFLVGGSQDSMWLPGVNFSLLPNNKSYQNLTVRLALSNFAMYVVA